MSKTGRRKSTRQGRHGRDKRFEQLLALASEGNEDAVGDLFREYGSPSTGSEQGGDA